MLHFTFINSHLSMNYQLSIINVAAWQMVNGKYLENGKWSMANTTGGSL